MSTVEEVLWFNTEVKPCEPALRAYLQQRFPGLADHDDLVQEAYIRLLNAHREGRVTCAKALLFTVTRNLAIDMFRRCRRMATHEPISEFGNQPLLEDAADPGDALEHQRQMDLLVDAIVALPDRCRAVMMLRHLDGLSYKEIGNRLGISANTVRVHMVKGVKDCTAFSRKQGQFRDLQPAASSARESVIR